jgi:MFS transporter, DHA3 family, macrolide efflux protein
MKQNQMGQLAMSETISSESRIPEPKNMKTFFVIWAGQLISMLGSSMTGFALGVWIFSETGQATPFALVILFSQIPRILLLPIAGSFADRWNRKALMIIADTASAAVTLLIFLLVSSGQLQLWQIYVLVAISSAFGAFQEPAYSASIVMLVPKKLLTRANGLIQIGQAIEMIMAPLMAGLLFVAIGLRGIILIDFITYFFALAALLIVRIPQPARTTEHESVKKPTVWGDMVFGWRYLLARSGLFTLLLYFAMVNFLLNFAAVLMGPLVLSTHSPSIFGSIQTVWGLGALVGSIIMSSWKWTGRKVPAIIGFIALTSLGLAVTGLRPSPIVIAGGMFFAMIFIPMASGLSAAVFQTKVAPDVQGRVFSMRSMISRAMMPLAYLLAGPLADYVFEPLMRADGGLVSSIIGSILGTGPGRGVGLMFVMAGIAGVIVSGLVFMNSRVRLLEDHLPDAVPDANPEGSPEMSPAD